MTDHFDRQDKAGGGLAALGSPRNLGLMGIAALIAGAALFLGLQSGREARIEAADSAYQAANPPYVPPPPPPMIVVPATVDPTLPPPMIVVPGSGQVVPAVPGAPPMAEPGPAPAMTSPPATPPVPPAGMATSPATDAAARRRAPAVIVDLSGPQPAPAPPPPPAEAPRSNQP